MIAEIDLSVIEDKSMREQMRALLNLVEKLSADIRVLREENQLLRDEINRLKGEQGKPGTKGNKEKSGDGRDHSSETERKQARKRHGSSKKGEIKVDRQEVVKVRAEELPADAQFKGYVEVVVQDIVIKTDNVLFRKEKYYSASTRKTYVAGLPEGYEGEFGPGVKAFGLDMYFEVGASEPKILGFLERIGLMISKGKFSSLLIEGQELFHSESDAVYESGLRSTSYQQTDSTLTRVNGQNQNCNVVCNPFYTVYRTLAHKDRMSMLDVLRNGRPRKFRLNQTALDCLLNVQLAQATRQTLTACCSELEWDEEKFKEHLAFLFPKLGHQQRKEITDAAAIAAYRAETEWPVIENLVCDDAPHYNKLTNQIMLCWVHEGRPYKKLLPVVPLHRQLLDDFLQRFWNYYRDLLAYKQNPSQAEHTRLEAVFDELFATQTGYDVLDERIAKTRAKKQSLLLVLAFPELPLHNNASELAVRRRVRKRDVSFGPRTEAGKRAWDTFMTLAETTRKLGLSFYAYLHDRITGAKTILPLPDLIALAAGSFTLPAPI